MKLTQLFKDLEEYHIKDEFLSNYDKAHEGDGYSLEEFIKEYVDLASSILSCFIWDETPEGHDFWANLRDHENSPNEKMKIILNKYRQLCMGINKLYPAVIRVLKMGHTLYFFDQFSLNISGLMNYDLPIYWAKEELQTFVNENYEFLPKLYTVKL